MLERCQRWIVNAARRRSLGQNPRRWSNTELRRIAPVFEGDIVNVSGWKDEDKEGGTYRGYFTRARSYTVTNYWGSRERNDGIEEALFLDLEGDLPPEFERRYDVAFSHTVLEHIFDVRTAVRNIARMTRDAAILVVPFMQDEHYTDALYGDCWRFTPCGLRRMLEESGLSIVYMNSNDTIWYPIYLCCVASKSPEQWRGRFGPEYDWSRRIGKKAFIYPDCVW